MTFNYRNNGFFSANTVTEEAAGNMDDGELRSARSARACPVCSRVLAVPPLSWSILTRIRDAMEEGKKEERGRGRNVCRFHWLGRADRVPRNYWVPWTRDGRCRQ